MAETCMAEHVAVGSEILLGQISNRHAQTISAAFASHGFFLYHHTSVGDNLDRIIEAFRIASSRVNVVIVTGGLGPTDDDLTKEALAAFLGRSLVLSEEALRDLEAFFATRNRPMPPANRKQAMCIEGGALIPNPNGTAPGQYVRANGVHYFLLPGPPLEMEPMLENHVLPRLHAVFGGTRALVSRILHFCGIGESDVDAGIRDLTSQSNPTVAPLAGEGEMLLRITASDVSESAARARIETVEEMIRSRYGSFIYGVDDDTLASVVGQALQAGGTTVAVAESCTGGLISTMITAVPGSSAYYIGGIVAYDNRLKQDFLDVSEAILTEFGAVSEETARSMAEGVRRRFGATFGLAVTGISGPNGGSVDKPVGLVYVAVSGPKGAQVFRSQHKGSREQIRLRSTKSALWRLWREVKETVPER